MWERQCFAGLKHVDHPKARVQVQFLWFTEGVCSGFHRFSGFGLVVLGPEFGVS